MKQTLSHDTSKSFTQFGILNNKIFISTIHKSPTKYHEYSVRKVCEYIRSQYAFINSLIIFNAFFTWLFEYFQDIKIQQLSVWCCVHTRLLQGFVEPFHGRLILLNHSSLPCRKRKRLSFPSNHPAQTINYLLNIFECRADEENQLPPVH